MKRWVLLFCLAVALPFPSRTVAQEDEKPALIDINVTDASGGPVGNAAVLILALPNVYATATADKDGKVSFAVPPGNYTLRMQMRGFRPFKTRFEARAGGHHGLSIQMTLASCAQCLVVGPCYNLACPLPSFPERSVIALPGGRYSIVQKGTSHTVELEDRVLGTRRDLFEYHRRVVFNSAGNWILATDYDDNHYSQCALYSVNEDIPPIQLLDLVLSQLDESERKGLRDVLRNRGASVEALDFEVNGTGQWGPGLGAKVSAYSSEGRLDFEWIFDVELPAR